MCHISCRLGINTRSQSGFLDGGKMLALRFWRCVACLFIYGKESIEMGVTNVPQESLVEAPTPNEIERDCRHEEIIPQLQDKKKS